MSERDLTLIWFTAERERNISGAFALAVTDWAERMPTKQNIELSVTPQFWGTIDFHSILFPTMEVNGALKQPGYKLTSKYIPLFSAKQGNSYRFGTTWGVVKDDRIFIFGWTIPLRPTNWIVI